MKLKSIFIAVSSVVCAAALWFAISATRAEAETRKAVALLAQKRAAIDSELRLAQERLNASEQRHTELQAILAKLKTSESAPGAALTQTAAPPTPTLNQRELLLKDPRLQALWLNSGRSRVAREYGPLYAALGLTAEQIEKFQTALIQRQEQLMDLTAVAQTQTPDESAAITTLRKQVNDAFEAAQRELLGPDGYRKLQEYERSRPMRMIVEGVAAAAALENAPLTATQATQLAEALARATDGYASGSRADLRMLSWEIADEQARAILAPAQLEIFKRATVRVELQLDAAVARAGAGAAPSREPKS